MEPEDKEEARFIARLASRDERAFNELVVATVGGVPVRVSDLGRAEDADAAVQGFVPIADRTKPERSLVNGILQTGKLWAFV